MDGTTLAELCKLFAVGELSPATKGQECFLSLGPSRLKLAYEMLIN